MVKKIISVLLASVIILAFAGCNQSSPVSTNNHENASTEPSTSETFYTDESGAFVRTEKKGTSVSAESLPCSVPHNDAKITVSSVNVYQDLIDDYYSYTAYVVVELDVSELDDAQIHWLRENDISVTVFLTNEQNGYDNEQMERLGNLLLEDTKNIYYVFTSSEWNDNRYDFAGSDMTLFIRLTQEEEFEADDAIRNKENFFMYDFTMSENPPSAETIEDPLYSYIAKWLGNRADFYGSMLN